MALSRSAASAASDPLPVGAMLADRRARARLCEALRPGVAGAPPHTGAPILYFDEPDEIAATVASRRLALLVVERHGRSGVTVDEVLRATRVRFPSVPVLGYAEARPGISSDVFALARAGVHELVLGGIDDVGVALRAALAQVVRTAVSERVLTQLADQIDPTALPLVRYCLAHAATAPTVPEIAQALGVHRKTLVNRLHAARLPPPSTVVMWCRLLLAADLLEDPGRSVEQIALSLDFPSGNALRNALRRHTDLSPREVRERGGFACAMGAFRAALWPARATLADGRRTTLQPAVAIVSAAERG